MSFVVPSRLARTVVAEPSPGRSRWLTDLPDTVRELACSWGLVVGEPFEPGGQTAWVAPVRDRLGRDRVLKVGWAHDEAEQEADGLRAWAGQGTVRIYDSRRLELTNALLLERCDPGIPLGEVRSEIDQDLIIADLLGRMWQAPTAGFPFRPLREMCQAWVAEFNHQLDAPPAAAAEVDPGLARAGAELFLILADTAERQVLLCTDLHADNVLAAEREPWLVIDPKPYVGDPCYDVLQHLLNCEERLADNPAGLAQRMADLTELDGDRVRQWLFARCVIESAQDRTLRAVAATLAPT